MRIPSWQVARRVTNCRQGGYFSRFSSGEGIEVGEGLASRLFLSPADDQGDDEAALGVDEHMVPVAAVLPVAGVTRVTVLIFFSPRRPRPHPPAPGGPRHAGPFGRGTAGHGH